MTETVKIDLPKGEWTLVGTGIKTLTAQPASNSGAMRLYVGSANPAGDVGLAVGTREVSLADLLTTDKVWMRSDSFDSAVWVIRG